MNLKTVTVTGADDSVDPGELMSLIEDFPFCEFGILFSSDRSNMPRFPSSACVERLIDAAVCAPTVIALSAHICGLKSRNLLVGRWESLLDISPCFRRIQLNFGGQLRAYDANGFVDAMRRISPSTQIILQRDGINDHLLDILIDAGIDAVPLHDQSCGRGVLPSNGWPSAMPFQSGCGYAGGLSEVNLACELGKINRVCGEVPIWIDAETSLRDERDRFDMTKVRAFLKAVEPFISEAK